MFETLEIFRSFIPNSGCVSFLKWCQKGFCTEELSRYPKHFIHFWNGPSVAYGNKLLGKTYNDSLPLFHCVLTASGCAWCGGKVRVKFTCVSFDLSVC